MNWKKHFVNLICLFKYETAEEIIGTDSQAKKYSPEQADSGTDYNSNDSVNQAPRLSVTQGVFLQRQAQGSGKKNRDSNTYKVRHWFCSNRSLTDERLELF